MKNIEIRNRDEVNHLNRRAFITRLSALAGVAAVGVAATSCMHSEGLDGVLYTIDANKCDGCEDCFSSCKFNAISISGEVAVISTSGCAGCGKCVSHCDQNAISRV